MAIASEHSTYISLLEALQFAAIAHRHQKRKYNNEPYINHCIDVANILQKAENVDVHMTIAALLHDTVEDCGITLEEIKNKFGDDVRNLVSDLTDVSKKEDGSREIRKNIDLEHSSKISHRAKTVKLADIISNTRNVVELSHEFARIYIPEKEKLVQALTDSDSKLYQLALDTLKEAKNKLSLC